MVNKRKEPAKYVLGMTLNWIQWCGSSSRTLVNVESPLYFYGDYFQENILFPIHLSPSKYSFSFNIIERMKFVFYLFHKS